MRNKLLTALAVLLTFAGAAWVMMKILPAPLEPFDFMLIGTVATLLAMLVLFLIAVWPSLKSGDVFVKRRRK
ncbi:MAG: hypothetical protein ABI824_00655 [Acidobacteriota bacterium]